MCGLESIFRWKWQLKPAKVNNCVVNIANLIENNNKKIQQFTTFYNWKLSFDHFDYWCVHLKSLSTYLGFVLKRDRKYKHTCMWQRQTLHITDNLIDSSMQFFWIGSISSLALYENMFGGWIYNEVVTCES